MTAKKLPDIFVLVWQEFVTQDYRQNDCDREEHRHSQNNTQDDIDIACNWVDCVGLQEKGEDTLQLNIYSTCSTVWAVLWACILTCLTVWTRVGRRTLTPILKVMLGTCSSIFTDISVT